MLVGVLLRENGAVRQATCYAFDHFESAIRQAQFLAEHFGVTVDASVASVYDIHRFAVRHYDYVIFFGVLYHLRYPMLALDMIADLDFDTMFLQTITFEDASTAKEYTEYIDGQKDRIFTNADFPTLKFVEHTIRSDHSSWYNFNGSAVEAMIRAAGITNVQRIAKEFSGAATRDAAGERRSGGPRPRPRADEWRYSPHRQRPVRPAPRSAPRAGQRGLSIRVWQRSAGQGPAALTSPAVASGGDQWS